MSATTTDLEPSEHDQAENNRGIRALLSLAPVYRCVQRAVGATAFRDTLVTEILRPAAGQRILDAGCGTADLLDHLPREVEYVGFDPNPRYVAMARRRFGERGTFTTASVQDVPGLLGSFDLVTAIGVLHHLDDDAVEQLVALAAQALRPGGRFVAVDPVLAPDQSRIARMLIRSDRGRHVRAPESTQALLETALSDVRVDIRHDMLRMPYSHLIAEARRAERAEP